MDHLLSDQDRAFRDDVRQFLTTELTPAWRRAGRRRTSAFSEPGVSRPWQARLNTRGWVAPDWPTDHGGTGWSDLQRYIFADEYARAGAPALSPMGLKMVGPVIMHYGTPEQKATLLPRILSGEDYWCQGYSEPGSGSDLASLKLRADVDGDDYVLNGSKIWTTHAHHANKMFALVRTSSEGRPQTGITFLLLDMTTPGITVTPIITLAGEHEVNQVFFDDVRVPRANRLGAENDGWTVAKHLLSFERGGRYAPALRAMLALLRDAATDNGWLDIDANRERLAREEIAVDALQAIELVEITGGGNQRDAMTRPSMLKILGTEATQRLDNMALDIAGDDLPALGENAGDNVNDAIAVALPRYMNNRAATIYGGSNEVQRGILAGALIGG